MVIAVRTEQVVQSVADVIRGMAAQAEAERRLPPELFDGLMEAGLFAIYTAVEFGGLDLPLPDALRVVEEVSRHDGSTGWTVALGVANSLFTSALPRESAARVLANGSALIAGAPAFGVRAVRVAGGYRLTGRWAFNSGAPNAHWIAAPTPIFDGDRPRIGEDGQPEMVLAFMLPTEVQIIDTWHTTGLRASGTQDLYVEDVFVPEETTGGFSLPSGPQPVRDCLLTKIPFFTLLGIAQAPPVCLGLAARIVEEFMSLAIAKQVSFGPRLSEQVQAQVGLARAEALLRSARAYYYESVQAIWNTVSDGREVSLAAQANVRLACLAAVESSVAAADLLYRLAGSTAIFQSQPLERSWRDVHTAGQHMQVQDARWETAGRVLFGLEPGSPVI